MAADGEIEKVSVRRSSVKDEEGRDKIILKSKREGASELPFDMRPPSLDTERMAFLWRHIDKERLHWEEPVTEHDAQQISLKDELDILSSILDTKIKFVEAQIPQQRKGKHTRL